MTAIAGFGYSPSSLKGFHKTFSSLQKFCDKEGILHYDESVGERFINKYKERQPPMHKESWKNYNRHIKRLNCTLHQVDWKPARRLPEKYTSSCYDDIVEIYEDYLVKTGKTMHDVRSRIHTVSRFLKHLEIHGRTNLKDLSIKEIYDAFQVVTDKGSFNRLVGSFLEYAYKYELTDSNLRIFMPSYVNHKTIPSVYTPAEVEQVLATIDRTTQTGKRDYATLLIAARLGLRASDIASLTFDCLCERTSMISLVQAKTKVPIKLPLTDEVKAALQDYIDNGRPASESERIFITADGHNPISPQTIGQATRIAFGRSGVVSGNRRIGPHALRASLATALLDEGSDYSTIQKALGHEDIQSTKFYAKASVEKLRANALPVTLPQGRFERFLSEGFPQYKRDFNGFSSIFGNEMFDFIKLRKSQGFSDDTGIAALVSLDKYLLEIGATTKEITPKIVDEWLSSSFGHLSAKSISNYTSYYNTFARYLGSLGISVFIADSPLVNQRYTPYIFSEQEIKDIFFAADNRKSRCDYLTLIQLPMLLRIMYGCGLRVDEALSLRLSDVSFERGTLFISHAKGNKDRLIPMDATLTDILKKYCDSVLEGKDAASPLFEGKRKDGTVSDKPRSQSWAQHNFRIILEEAGIELLQVFAGERNICLYCLRHTFAVNSLRNQGIVGATESSITPLLSIYLGHDELRGTEKYLHMTAENAEDILELTAEYSIGLFPEVPHEE
jgi:site-specific recombinase XerD